jgi:hypothetical protein
MPYGTILDPATTRPEVQGMKDPVTGLVAIANGFARDPFVSTTGCPIATTTAFTLAGCGLNQIPAGRLDPNAIKLLNLYPSPTGSSLFSNYAQLAEAV